VEVSDGELVRLAGAGDQAAFRVLAERYLPMARARASRLCADPCEAEDVVQESFLQAFTGLGRLRDPDRFAGWLAGIVVNVHRAARRRPPPTLLAVWPEQLQPATAGGVPSAEDMDRADVLRQAIAALPPGQRRAVTLFYYADLPAEQIGDSAGAVRVSLHKARQHLRGHLAAHRPDLIPATARRTDMTRVRIARAEARPGDLGDGRFAVNQVLVVLADDAGHRAVPVWLNASDGGTLWRLLSPGEGEAELERVPEQLTTRLLRAAGVTVTAVDIDEIGPGLNAARITVTGAGGTKHVAARLADGLSLAAAAQAPVHVADTVMGQLAVPAGEDLLAVSGQPDPALSPGARRPHREPKNLDFTSGLARWDLTGSYLHHPSGTHRQDYECVTQGQSVVLRSAVPQPHGFAAVRQAILADGYRDSTVAFRADLRAVGVADQAGLFLRVSRGPVRARRGDPGNHLAAVTGSVGWDTRELTAEVPDQGSYLIHFGAFLIGAGQIELRSLSLSPPAMTVTEIPAGGSGQ
jgi:RNA polymerase sigma-70 factor, ECF subfamily